MEAGCQSRDQWPSVPKAYVTSSASIDLPVFKTFIPETDILGIGISGVKDASGNNQLKLNYGSVSISYHKALDEDGYNTIGAGFQELSAACHLISVNYYSKITLRKMDLIV